MPDPGCLAGLRKWRNGCSCLCPVLGGPLGGGWDHGCRLRKELEFLVHRKGSEAGGARASEVGSRQLLGLGSRGACRAVLQTWEWVPTEPLRS